MAIPRQYQVMRPSLKTGDAIGFAGTGIVSDVIRLCTQPNLLGLSHVGIVVRVDAGSVWGDSVLVAESTTMDADPDSESHQKISGVQFHFLSAMLAAYPGRAWHFGLKSPLSDNDAAVMQDWLRQEQSQKVGYNYAGVTAFLIQMLTKLNLQHRADYRLVFCSELACRALQVAGAIDASRNPGDCSPASLCQMAIFNPGVPVKE